MKKILVKQSLVLLLKWKDNRFNDLIKNSFQICAKQCKEREKGKVHRGFYTSSPQPWVTSNPYP